MVMKKYINYIIVSVLVLILSFLWIMLWSKASKVQSINNETVDFSDVDNTKSVDNKLGEDLKITAGYLNTYIRFKQGTWYKSVGYIQNIDSNCNIVITSSLGSKESIKGSATSCEDLSVGDKVNFVGAVDISDQELNIAKISKEDIDYDSSERVDIEDLISNLNKLFSNYFIIDGYMVTDENRFLLYESKQDYEDKSKNYFVLNFNNINVTGNAKVTVRCQIKNSYTLINCELKQ